MANTVFSGSITTSGTSEAIRLDKALFRTHPEFSQKTKVKANVIGRGQILISVVDDTPPTETDEDPILEAFLGFLENDIKANLGGVIRLSRQELSRAKKLTRDVSLAEDEGLPDEVTF